MTPKLKEKLLLRKFSSVEYMEEFAEHYFSFIEAGVEAVESYKKKPPGTPQANYEGDLKLWELKVLPNYRFMYNSMRDEIKAARSGNTEGIESAAADLRGLGKAMDGIRESFMDAIDPNIKRTYFEQLKLARKKGNNIYLTLNDWWDDDQLLDTEITGPIDEQDLLLYLNPGETEDS